MERQGSDKQIIGELAAAYKTSELVVIMTVQMSRKYFQSAKRILKMDKNNEDAIICLAHMEYLNPNKWSWVIQLLQRASSIHPKSVHILVLMGALYCFENRFEEGVKTFSKAIDIAPSRWDIYYLRAAAKRNTDRHDCLPDYFKYLQNIDPQDRKVPEGQYLHHSIFIPFSSLCFGLCLAEKRQAH